MDVGVSKSHVFVNYSPRVLLSQWSIPAGLRRVMDAVKEGPGRLSSAKVLAVAAGLSVGATVGYIIYRHVSRTNNDPDSEVSKMTLPVEVYRNISRHENHFLDVVMQKSGALVRLVSNPGNSGNQASVLFLLQGSKEQVLIARCALEKLVNDSEPVSEVLEVPQTSLGRIIGRHGNSLKTITRTTGAKVFCPRDKSRSPGAKESVTISGNRQAVQKAMELILEKVSEDTMVRTMISKSSAQRHKRGQSILSHNLETAAPPPCLNNNVTLPKENNIGLQPIKTLSEPAGLFKKMKELSICNSDNKENKEDDDDKSLSTESLTETTKFEISSPDLSFQPDEHLEVYVSAVENPNHFWIQILGVRSLHLDKLTEEMTRYYGSDSTVDQGVETLAVGDIVAAQYMDHGIWNRARVVEVLDSGLVDLYYVDFGDNGELPRDALRRMRSDFLSLPFQAIECSLAEVQPKGEAWTEDALDQFEELTYCALWKPLQAKLCSYSHSEVSSWPSVKLYDSNQGKTLDIGQELIRLNHAISFQETLKEKTEGDNMGCLQRMLEDVIGASSQLSMSCISLSETASISGSADDMIVDDLL